MKHLNKISFFSGSLEVDVQVKYNMYNCLKNVKGIKVDRVVLVVDDLEREVVLMDRFFFNSIYYFPKTCRFYFSVFFDVLESFVDHQSLYFMKEIFYEYDVFKNNLILINAPRFNRPYNERSTLKKLFCGDHETCVSPIFSWINIPKEEFEMVLSEYNTYLYYKVFPMYLSSCKFNARDEIVFFNLETGKFEDKHLDLFTPPNFDK